MFLVTSFIYKDLGCPGSPRFGVFYPLYSVAGGGSGFKVNKKRPIQGADTFSSSTLSRRCIRPLFLG